MDIGRRVLALEKQVGNTHSDPEKWLTEYFRTHPMISVVIGWRSVKAAGKTANFFSHAPHDARELLKSILEEADQKIAAEAGRA